MIYAAIKLRDKIVEVISRAKYQPGVPRWDGTPSTWCNEAANAVLVEMGFDTSLILHPKGIGWTGATAMYLNSVSRSGEAFSGIEEITGRQAQSWANIGIPVLAAAKNPDPKKSSHVGIVSPDDDAYLESRGPFVGDAGAKNDFQYASKQFPGLGKIRYFLLTPKMV